MKKHDFHIKLAEAPLNGAALLPYLERLERHEFVEFLTLYRSDWGDWRMAFTEQFESIPNSFPIARKRWLKSGEVPGETLADKADWLYRANLSVFVLYMLGHGVRLFHQRDLTLGDETILPSMGTPRTSTAA